MTAMELHAQKHTLAPGMNERQPKWEQRQCEKVDDTLRIKMLTIVQLRLFALQVYTNSEKDCACKATILKYNASF